MPAPAIPEAGEAGDSQRECHHHEHTTPMTSIHPAFTNPIATTRAIVVAGAS